MNIAVVDLKPGMIIDYRQPLTVGHVTDFEGMIHVFGNYPGSATVHYRYNKDAILCLKD